MTAASRCATSSVSTGATPSLDCCSVSAAGRFRLTWHCGCCRWCLVWRWLSRSLPSTGRRSLGVALRRDRAASHSGRVQSSGGPATGCLRCTARSADARADSLAALLHDPDLLAAHRRMLPPARRPGIDPLNIPLVIGAARLSEATVLDAVWPTLSAAEKAAVLSDGPAIERLVILSGAQKPRSSASVAG